MPNVAGALAAPTLWADDFRELSAATQILPERQLSGQSIVMIQGQTGAEGPGQESSLWLMARSDRPQPVLNLVRYQHPHTPILEVRRSAYTLPGEKASDRVLILTGKI